MFSYDPNMQTGVLPKGEYDAELKGCKDSLSKKGNEMVELSWSVRNKGHTISLTDWISNTPFGVAKLRRLAEAMGEDKLFRDAMFNPANFKGKYVGLTLDIGKDQKGNDQNSVTDYKPARMEPPPSAPSSQSMPDDSERIPF